MYMDKKHIEGASKLDAGTLFKTGCVRILPGVASLVNGGYGHSSYHAMLLSLFKIDYDKSSGEYNVKPEDAVEVVPVLTDGGNVREVHSADEYEIWLEKAREKADEIVKRYID